MFRAALFSIVLVLALGQNAMVLCKVWCDPAASAVSGCHDSGRSSDSPSVARAHSCDDASNETAFLKEDVRRSVSAFERDRAIAVPPYQLVSATTTAHRDREVCPLRTLEKRPRETSLRI